VKQELARELYSLLVGDETRARCRNRIDSITDDSEAETSSDGSYSPSSTMDLDDPNVVIPLSMVALVEYASTASSSQVKKSALIVFVNLPLCRPLKTKLT
jgi:hypothetical protein